MENKSVRYLKGVGPRKEALFNKIGIHRLRDILYYFPFRYEDRRNFQKISSLKIGASAAIKGKVASSVLTKMPYFRNSRKVRSIFEIILEDDTGSVKCSWFNQPWLYDSITPQSQLIVYGKLYRGKRGLQIVSPDYELSDGDSLAMGRIVPVYSLPALLNQKFMRKLLAGVLTEYALLYPESLPQAIRQKRNIPSIGQALQEIHLPSSWLGAQASRERFIFEELFFSQILVYLRKAKRVFQKGPEFRVKEASLDKIRQNLDFKLTDSQDRALAEILADLVKLHPMHRLLQGDVGCGKTVVAVFAIAVCVDSGYQSAVMVPTEVLAYQHKESLSKILKDDKIRVLTASLTRAQREDIYKGLASGQIKVIVGTHSLIQDALKFKNLGLVVIDEQHRFGVAQRALLLKKGDLAPHCLVMSATPIPRSLALSLYGDLELSTIDHMPPGRKKPNTRWLEAKQRKEVYDFLRQKLGSGRQVYIVFPLIEESQSQELNSLKAKFSEIKKSFAPYKVGMFHGKMKSEDKIRIINDFKAKKIDILLSTTVVEVGLSIENATVMVVENPERFGLAQLHQLRGRIQRSDYEPHFILISSKGLSSSSQERLKIISRESCGFKIAEEDLRLRGPGDFFGQLQHGLGDLRIADPIRDLDILKQARIFAYQVIKNDPHLKDPEHKPIKDHLHRVYNYS